MQVVRQSEFIPLADGAELFMLADPRTLTIFKVAPILDSLNWVDPDLLFVRLHDEKEQVYRERVVSDEHGRFVRFERDYSGDSRLARVALTSDMDLARMWQSASSPRDGWRRLRQVTPRRHRLTASVDGWVYDRVDRQQRFHFVQDLIAVWRRPDSTIARVRQGGDNHWLDDNAVVGAATRVIGPVWIGAGRRFEGSESIIGPAAIWDDPSARPPVEDVSWLAIERTTTFDQPVHARRRSGLERGTKRAFDIVFATFALLLTAPIYPLVMLAIWIEDGRPFFFGHRRETIGGREFNCWKFRSMRKDAEKIKAQLQAQNKADGPQFFIEDDPRLTRVGKIIRALNIDELPQFINVLLGHMSIVGPRPSPYKENQFCPGWREARLSVRPGITGLWQVRRSRVQGLDFQEWIRYDIEYVEKGNWALDFWIILQTFKVLLRAIIRP